DLLISWVGGRHPHRRSRTDYRVDPGLVNAYVKISESGCIQAHAGHPGDYISIGDPTCQGKGCLPLNAPCDPNVPCCGNGVCQNGACIDLCAGVTCEAPDQCHTVGVCNPNTGICS